VILNQKGRVLDPDTSNPLPGLYTAGWIKRGPTGVIGTNKSDAQETVKGMMQDLQQGGVLSPPYALAAAADKRLREHQPLCVSYADWQQLNAMEVARGKAIGRPRLKFTRVEDMLAALRKASPV
jgi:ferredoxin--NADP+ reductase